MEELDELFDVFEENESTDTVDLYLSTAGVQKEEAESK